MTPDIQVIEAEIRILEQQRDRFTTPPYLGSGLAVLGLFTVLGIFIPLGLIPQRASDYSNSWRAFVLGCFGIGIVAVIIYTAFLIRYLKRSNAQASAGRE